MSAPRPRITIGLHDYSVVPANHLRDYYELAPAEDNTPPSALERLVNANSIAAGVAGTGTGTGHNKNAKKAKGKENENENTNEGGGYLARRKARREKSGMAEPRVRVTRHHGRLNFENDLRHLLHAYGDPSPSDSTNPGPHDPLPETLRVLDEITTDFIIETAHGAAAVAHTAGRQKVKVDDFKFMLRGDPTKLGRVQELFRIEHELKEARKAFDQNDDKVIAAKKGGGGAALGEELAAGSEAGASKKGGKGAKKRGGEDEDGASSVAGGKKKKT
ncbi:hypothetical protein AJ80_04230 [Polytolypa hystricis UAMH7299]|uniref:Transcription initiation factor TFIID subunit 13 n=1 Tax=Polytolypa hystricis (strain UAMH7299) TaxID=1447883 RepID=A0A2B7YD81_POLH7|nr:hypothetical protein AJ80_04230 [Polytolypa hystricis UAMH7299]